MVLAVALPLMTVLLLVVKVLFVAVSPLITAVFMVVLPLPEYTAYCRILDREVFALTVTVFLVLLTVPSEVMVKTMFAFGSVPSLTAGVTPSARVNVTTYFFWAAGKAASNGTSCPTQFQTVLGL